MALVQAPVPPHREKREAHLVEGDVRRADRAGQDRGVNGVDAQLSLLGQQLPGRPGLGFALLAQVDVGPAREAVLGVPGTLTMT